MRVDLEDFGTGWYGVSACLKPDKIDRLVECLTRLKSDPDYHFHFRSDFEAPGGGVADVGIYPLDADDSSDNLQLSGAPPIRPHR